MKICKNCGKEYAESKVKGGYCSNKCDTEFKKWNFKPNTKCPVCKKEFYIKQFQLSKSKNTCCSLDCSSKLRKITMSGENNHQYGLTGDKNSSFKEYRNERHGYYNLYEPDHPFCDDDGRILEHRLMAEKFLLENKFSIDIDGKKYLSPDFVVHHKDQNKKNNNIENLQILTKSQHTSIHNFLDNNNMKVKKFSSDLPDFKMLEKGDWIDMYVNRATNCDNNINIIEEHQNRRIDDLEGNDFLHFQSGDVIIVGFGVSIELPKNCEAEIRPRSSTFKNTGLLLTNSVGTIDESYKGDNDEWQGMFYATRDGRISRFDRLVQFKISEKMIKPKVKYVESLNNENRGGYGSTGK